MHWQGPSNEEGDDIYEGFGDTIIKGVEEVIGDAPVYFEGTDVSSNKFVDLEEMLAAAKSVDKVVIGMGEHAYAGEFGNIGELLLPARQLGLVYEISAVTKAPITVVLVQGRPRIVGMILGLADAVVNAYLPGAFGGLPIAEILYGIVNPSGRLPYTYPATEAQASTTVWQPACSGYNPQWGFGYGLGYSTTVYSEITVSSSTISAGFPITLSVVVINNGPYQQKETVMLYSKQEYRFNLAPENNRLRKFTKVDLKVGEAVQVVFILNMDDFVFWNMDMTRSVQTHAPVTLQINPYTHYNVSAVVSLAG
ncbi:hypothetical protein LPJ59_003864 [Coemansia sp. RSA 2399]|nr:hypothetical protein LPJ59_003864 [Coemansia sp. RSA 2399]KAJ1902578.1 hypothetical protein LPJ81_003528 [Coemansia sp. IMI 209127]